MQEYGKAQQLAEAIASGEKLDRKVYRIRNKELVKFIDKDFEGMKDIHIISESNLLNHSFMDLVGTVDEVKLTEELILENVLKFVLSSNSDATSNLYGPHQNPPPQVNQDVTEAIQKVAATYNSKIVEGVPLELECEIPFLEMVNSQSNSKHIQQGRELHSVTIELEKKWYACLEELYGMESLSANIYNLGILLFELLSSFASLEMHSAAMSYLQYQILPLFISKSTRICLLSLAPSSSPFISPNNQGNPTI
ncbi:hypothetical protein Lser_V15G13438 [Lactuca serriola]